MSKVLQINNLTKHYGHIRAVDGFNLDIEPGMIYGLLGPNGSGKTTTLGILLGIIRPKSGTFEWFEGRYGQQHRFQIGALLETPNFYPYLNAVDNLALVAHIKKISHPKIDEALQLVNLHHRRKASFRTYSLGMKQRLAIAAALIGDPEVLILDEPTNGLDPTGIAEVRETIIKIGQAGKTILMASHILAEVEKICTHVAIIKNGKLLAAGPIGTILSDDKIIELSSENLEVLISFLNSIQGIRKMEQQQNIIQLYVDPTLKATEINRLAFEKGIILNHLYTRKQSLEAEFLEITKANLS